ncbi:Glutathione transport system permease protein gsiD [Mycoplasmopsis californica]|uniref:ABC transporter permease n=1 Tax=Mycoplasmopsis equigenitalium TaxID=114883 RepID=A0ABY5J4U5_9BACT|nr:ABC transporter permease [Mycoplasmopsis equigenitalium]UUD36985.1 ABC transporter permease [Mycoplasmopsis equigenitalium]VEU69719.1 Glutathione transport system permease protein gsiD [Mycoplasmopsis californica]
MQPDNFDYKLTPETLNLLKFKQASSEIAVNEIAGKPKNMIVEIFKRYFKNPYVVVATIIFIAIIATAILVNRISPHNHPENLKEGFSPFKVDKNNTDTFSLPPSWQAIRVRTFNKFDDPDAALLMGISRFQPALNEKMNFHYEILSDSNGNLYTPADSHLQFIGNNAENFTISYNAYEFNKVKAIVKAAYSEGIITDPKDLYEYFDQSNKLVKTKVVLDKDFVNKIYDQQKNIFSLLGTDNLGRDIWTRTWAGTWESIQLALIVATIETIIGVSVGAILGFNVGKRIDTIAMRLIEIITAPPTLIIFLMLVSILGTSNVSLAICLIVIGWTGPVAGTRMYVLTVKDEEYILAAKSVGAKTPRQIFFHALPAVLGKIAYSFVRRIPAVIFSVSSLAFLGFFPDNTSSNLGKLLIDSINQAGENIWILLLPSLILLLLSLSLHFIALGVHDALDPKVIRVK